MAPQKQRHDSLPLQKLSCRLLISLRLALGRIWRRNEGETVFSGPFRQQPELLLAIFLSYKAVPLSTYSCPYLSIRYTSRASFAPMAVIALGSPNLVRRRRNCAPR